MPETLFDPQILPTAPSLLGESPFWHPDEAALYWCDIPGRSLNRYTPATRKHEQWHFDCEPASCAPFLGGDVLLAMRDGLWRFTPSTGRKRLLAPPPYDPARERFNDGKADAQGRFWVGTIYEPRDRAAAALYCWRDGLLQQMAGDVTVSNGLAWSPDGRTMYWSDTKAHQVQALTMNPQEGSLSERRTWMSFAPKQPGQALETYGGRPDGAAVDSEGCYWSAQFEGQNFTARADFARGASASALPHHALLWWARLAHTLHHDESGGSSGRRAGVPAVGRACFAATSACARAAGLLRCGLIS